MAMKTENKAEVTQAAQTAGANPLADEFFNAFKAEWEKMNATPDIEIEPRRPE